MFATEWDYKNVTSKKDLDNLDALGKAWQDATTQEARDFAHACAEFIRNKYRGPNEIGLDDGNTIVINNKSSSVQNISPAAWETAYTITNNLSTGLTVAGIGIAATGIGSGVGVAVAGVGIAADVAGVGIAAYQGKKGYISNEKATARVTMCGLSAISGGIARKAKLVKDIAVEGAANIYNGAMSLVTSLFG